MARLSSLRRSGSQKFPQSGLNFDEVLGRSDACQFFARIEGCVQLPPELSMKDTNRSKSHRLICNKATGSRCEGLNQVKYMDPCNSAAPPKSFVSDAAGH
jgi:hypothetical protein